ncbi:hypothetical protein E3E36_01950 [Thermococcus sp. M36]|uniref:cell wall-binding repeat-containing protein n=1 Tax=Thermococcus sp. M36 TaxID=1638261 RepID=UPI00143AEA74|nr:hypothetical protein [Thermococcus sp. M36]NJE04933.1 hypothetical protein [Thermococcus sp. M36]
MSRQIIPVIMMFILIAGSSPASLASASEGGQGIAILVSDNGADMAVAQNVGELLGAEVFVSPWGMYSAEISAEILSSEPERVIIIGGPVAVPEEYTKDFSVFGISYERWYGETRYETNRAVMSALKEEFPSVFSGITTVVIANGRDILAIEDYMNRYAGKSVLILTDAGREALTMQVLREFGSLSEVKYIETGSFPVDKNGLGSWIRTHFGNVSFENVSPAPGPLEVYSLLTVVENRTRRAEGLLDGLQVPQAKKKLESARKAVELAWEKYRMGRYEEAYRLAVKAGTDSDFVIAAAYRELRTVYQGSLELRLRIELTNLEVMAGVLKRRGYDVSDIEALLDRARGALQEGDYSTVLNDLLPRIRGMLAEKTVRRAASRGSGRSPPARRPGRP